MTRNDAALILWKLIKIRRSSPFSQPSSYLPYDGGVKKCIDAVPRPPKKVGPEKPCEKCGAVSLAALRAEMRKNYGSGFKS